MMNKSLLIASAVFLSATATAQTVVPLKYATTEASTWTAWPFGLSGPARLQYLYSSTLIGPTVIPIAQIAFRGNGGRSAAAKTGVDLEIMVSTTKTDPWTASTTFASNHGTNVSTVFTRKKINLPAQPTSTPNAFVTVFKLDKPFVYIKVTGNLLIDYIVHGQPAGSYSHDTSFTSSSIFTTVGTACGGASMSIANGRKLNASSTIDYNLTGAPNSGVAIHLLGTAALPAPVPLPIGNCKLFQDIFFLLVVPTSATGTVQLKYLLPTNARDIVIYGQFVAFNATLTQLVGTQSIKTAIGGLDPHTRILHTSSATTATGRVQLGVGIVTELR